MIVRLCCVMLLTLLCCSMASAGDISLKRSDWHLLSYRGIPSHALTDTPNGLKLSIRKSASPVVATLASPVSATAVEIRAKVDGTLDLSGLSQGQAGADDFRLRIGLVYAGGKVLDEFQSALAPRWVKRLQGLLPDSVGISHVQFLNTYTDSALANLQRMHPTTALWRESFVLQVDQSGSINQRVVLKDELPILGIWISADGDDTGSCFDVTLQQVRFE